MKLSRTNTYGHGQPAATGRQISGWQFLLMFLSLALIVLSRLDHSLVTTIQTTIRDRAAPALEWATNQMTPLARYGSRLSDALQTGTELERLRERNAVLRRENQRLRDIAERYIALGRVAKLTSRSALPTRTARVIAQGGGPFHHALTIDYGRTDGARTDAAVLVGDHLIGRLVTVGRHTAIVLLLRDPASRIPVMIGPDSIPAIAVGTTEMALSLKHLPSPTNLQPGQVVRTSGAAGTLPTGLPLGTVQYRNGAWDVATDQAPAMRLFVQVVQKRRDDAGMPPMLPGRQKPTRRLIGAVENRARTNTPANP